jgi:hypothetical protein
MPHKSARKRILDWREARPRRPREAPQPRAIVRHADTRGADKYAGYFRMGLSLERIVTDMQAVPFRDEVWPKCCARTRERVLGLG